MTWPARRTLPAIVALAVAGLGAAGALSGCGLNVELADLFLITRTGPGTTLTLDVNDSGQITCNGGRQKLLSSAQLITARDLSDDLTTDATRKLTIKATAGTVFYYRVKMQQGTISFPDRAAAGHRYLPQLELFVTQVAQSPCGLTG